MTTPYAYARFTDIVELCSSVVNVSALPSPFIYVNYYSITGSIAGWFRFFTLIQCFEPTGLIRSVAALRHETCEAYSVCYFQGLTFASPSGKLGSGHKQSIGERRKR